MQTQWQVYKQLELIPTATPEPKANPLMNMLFVNHLWRSLINALAQEHVYEQRRDYFERCWAIDDAAPYTTTHTDQFKKLLTLMD